MSLIKMMAEWLGPKVIIDTLNNQDAKSFGRQTGGMIREGLTNEFARKGYEKIRPQLISWLDQFYLATRKKLIED